MLVSIYSFALISQVCHPENIGDRVWTMDTGSLTFVSCGDCKGFLTWGERARLTVQEVDLR